jgi:broad specificity phosphatase PhoE
MKFSQNFTTFYVVRHGQTVANASKVVAGHFDSPLNEVGEKQAKARGEELKHIHFDAVFSSDLVRAKKTAEFVKLNRELAVNTKEILRERFFGEYEGKPEEDFYKNNLEIFEKIKTLGEKEKQKLKYYDTYENNEETATRMLTFIREVAATYSGKTVLIVSHGSIMRSFLMHLGFVTYDQLPAGSIDNLGYFKLMSDGVDFFVSGMEGIHIKNIA